MTLAPTPPVWYMLFWAPVVIFAVLSYLELRRIRKKK